ncbi:MAG TPA: nucleotide exchange factor GrpE [Solirubrobacterales bacterium]|jgi:molecular chaperone GrpE
MSPERPPRPAGPVAGEDSSSSRDDAAGEEPTPTPPAGEAVEADIDSLLAEAEEKRDEYLDLAKRTKADFENFRRRMAAETAAAGARGKADLIREVVPVLDDLERALQAAGLDPEGDSPDGLAHGVLLVFRSLREALARNGVEPVDPSGEAFDPQQHEAISTLPGSGAAPGTVVEVVQKGYLLGDQLVRPARVVVAE